MNLCVIPRIEERVVTPSLLFNHKCVVKHVLTHSSLLIDTHVEQHFIYTSKGDHKQVFVRDMICTPEQLW